MFLAFSNSFSLPIVPLPAKPSAFSPFSAWNFLTSFSVAGPKAPSQAPNS